MESRKKQSRRKVEEGGKKDGEDAAVEGKEGGAEKDGEEMKVEEEGARKVQLEAEKNNGQEEEVSVAIEVETDLPVLEAVALEVLVLEAAQD